MAKNETLISVEERILLHLINYGDSKHKHRHYVPIGLSQEGIAKAVGVSRGYIPYTLKKLVAQGYAKTSIGRVEGGKRKQKCYQLTDEGRKHTKKLKNRLSNLQITLKQPDGSLKTMELKNVMSYLEKKKLSPDITEMDIYKILSKYRTLDIDRLEKLKKMHFVDFSAEAPMVMHFFGRKRELTLLDRWVGDKEEHNLIFIHGMAGIGKTTLAAKLIEGYRQSKHLFWHNFNELDTLRGVLFKLAKFLSNLGDDHLELYMRARITLDYSEISGILGKRIGTIDAVLVFDDFHKTNDKIRSFFIYFLRMLSSSSNTKMLILSRESVPFYDIRDVLARKIVAELGLEGLDFKSSKRLLKEKGIDKSRFKEIHGLTAGNPLFLEIFESKDHLERYLHDELFLQLGEDEREILGMISIYRFPIPEDSLAVNEDFDYEKLYALTKKSIIKKDAHARYFVHDLIKGFFYSRLSPSKRRKSHLLAARWYEGRNEPIDFIEAIYHYLEGGRNKKACQLAIDSSAFILDGGYAAEFFAILERFDEKDVQPNIWSELLMVKGKALYMAGEWKKALLNHTQSADIASVIGNHELKVRAICESGLILEEQNELEKAMDCFNRCLEISKRTEYPRGMGKGYRGIGRIHWRKSEHEEAIVSFEKSLEISNRIGDLDLMASTCIDLGNVYDEMFKIEKAIEYYNMSIDTLKKVKNTYETARTYANLAITYRHIENFNKAIEYHEKQLELAKNLSDMKLLGYGYASLSYCLAKIQEFEKASKYAMKAEDIALKIDNENIMFQVNRTYALICKHGKKWEEAVKYFQKSIEIVEKSNTLYAISELHFELGLLYEEMGDVNNAKKHLEIATNLYNELGLRKTELISGNLKKYNRYLKKNKKEIIENLN